MSHADNELQERQISRVISMLGESAIANGYACDRKWVEASARMGVSESANGCKQLRDWVEAPPRLGGSAFAPGSKRVARRVIVRSRSGQSDFDVDSERVRDWVEVGRTMGGERVGKFVCGAVVSSTVRGGRLIWAGGRAGGVSGPKERRARLRDLRVSARVVVALRLQPRGDRGSGHRRSEAMRPFAPQQEHRERQCWSGWAIRDRVCRNGEGAM
jgi:hypothetical protein